VGVVNESLCGEGAEKATKFIGVLDIVSQVASGLKKR
jgi:myosin heavy subunit